MREYIWSGKKQRNLIKEDISLSNSLYISVLYFFCFIFSTIEIVLKEISYINLLHKFMRLAIYVNA